MCLPVQCWFFTITINWWNVLVLFLRIFLLWSKNRKYNMIQLNLFKKYRYFWHFCSCSYFQDVSFKEMQPSQITHCGNWMHAFCAHGRCHWNLIERENVVDSLEMLPVHMILPENVNQIQMSTICARLWNKIRANQEHCSLFGKTKILSKFKIPFEMNWIANDIIIIPFWYNCQNSRFDGAENRKYFSQELKIDQFKVMVGSVWFGLFSIRSVWFRW